MLAAAEVATWLEIKQLLQVVLTGDAELDRLFLGRFDIDRS